MKNCLKFTIFLGMCCSIAFGQLEESSLEKVSYSDTVPRTKLAYFEPDLVLSSQEQIRIRQKYKEHIAFLNRLIDTLDIPEKRRQKLFIELRRNPFSERLQKIVADLGY